MRGTLVGIDIGTTAITTVVAQYTKGGKLRVLGMGTVPASGLRRGTIIDVEDAAQALKRSLGEAGRASGSAVRSAVVSIGGAHIGSFTTRGVIAISRADGEITEDDVARVIRAAEGFIPKNPNREIIHLIPREFKIDGLGGITDPVGMVGMKLEVEALVVDGAKPALQNVIKCCELAGVTIEDWVVSSLAAAETLLSKKQKELGVMLLDLGAGTSDFAVFEEGRLFDVGSFPIGGGNITSDIAIGFRIHVAAAEEIKLRHAQIVNGERANRRESIQLGDFIAGETAVFLIRDLGDIVAARLTDIFELATKALRKIGRVGLLPGGVVLAGGVADIPGIHDVARRELKLPVEVAKAIALDAVEDVVPARLAIPLGLILWQSQHYGDLSRRRHRRWGAFLHVLRRLLGAFVP